MVSMEENTTQNQEAFGGGMAPSPLQNQPPQPGVVGVVASTPKRKNNFIALIIFAFLIILIIAAVVYFIKSSKTTNLSIPSITKIIGNSENSGSQEIVEATPAESRILVGGTEGWSTFEREGVNISFKYPKEVTILDYSDGAIVLRLWGPTQKEGTEFYDGLSMSFKVAKFEGKTLKETAGLKYLQLKEFSEVTPPVVGLLAGTSGYTMHIKGIFSADYYYVPINETLYLEVINGTKDPTKAGYSQQAETVLLTLEFKP